MSIANVRDTRVRKYAGQSRARPRHRRLPAELPDAVAGRMAEICRDLAVQAKRMRQIEQQADELRTVIRRWAASLDAPRGSTSRAGRG